MRTSALILLCAIGLVACSSSEPPREAVQSTSTPYHLTLNVKQLMAWVIEPSADVLWDSVGTVITAEGREEHLPQTDEEWQNVRNHAAMIAESGNLLMMEGRAFDGDRWMKDARGMIDAAKTAIAAAEAKDVQGLFDAGGAVYESCTACHATYALGLPQK
jgi:hypothetical protein